MAFLRSILVLFAVLLPGALAAQEAAEATPVKRIALSFDDTPRFEGALYSDDERSIRLIAALHDGDVKQAAFFLNPGKLAEKPGGHARIAAYVAAGHVIANHTFSHPQLRDTDAQAYINDIGRAAKWLDGRDGNRPWFRFPFLDEGGKDKVKRDAIRTALDELGLTNGYVTIDASDWFYDSEFSKSMRAGKSVNIDAMKELFVESHVGAAEVYDRIARDTLGRSPAHVMLLHESDLTVLALPDLIKALKADGWEFITADEAYADPIAKEMPDVPFSQGTLTEMIAWERGMPAPRWYGRNDTRIAGLLFRERVLGEAPEPEE
ncbi:polysaccharide deacetylase family protein [Erythrobacter crassostreae]|uniref:Chitooligosaccharide deacetylase n=1 Tax=Erythrobacter crassostreae TaxID=2828328 RepID=A0A9X1JL89_9SPHN|nr:polysaccharide deacetylase family protein [Erythrobacter crassostrea]MBV7258084.1 polysaccharide deacetylase family protein [Erythrobacter crassostrea]